MASPRATSDPSSSIADTGNAAHARNTSLTCTLSQSAVAYHATAPSSSVNAGDSQSSSPDLPTAQLASFHLNVPILADDEPSDLSMPETDPLAYLREVTYRSGTRNLYEKYGLNLDSAHRPTGGPPGLSSFGTAPPAILRTEKRIRVRVRYQCHECSKTLGPDSHCTACQHSRCSLCPREPSRSPRSRPSSHEQDTVMTDVNHPTTAPEPSPHAAELPVVQAVEPISLPAEPKQPRQVPMPLHENYQAMLPVPVLINTSHHICHACCQDFIPPGASICRNCGHRSCGQCVRDAGKNLLDRSIDKAQEMLEQSERQQSENAAASADAMSCAVPMEPVDHTKGFNARDPAICNNLEIFTGGPAKRPSRTTVFRPTRQVVRWTCDKCTSIFEVNATVCSSCLHKKCGQCIREPSKRHGKQSVRKLIYGVDRDRERAVRPKRPVANNRSLDKMMEDAMALLPQSPT